MPTDKQLAANRRNARRSTGPRTTAGKARSSRNAVRHGLRARFAVLPGEDSTAFSALCRRFTTQFRPAGTHQQILVEQMALAYWKLARIGRLEARLYSCYSTDEDPVHFYTVVDLHRPPDAPPPPSDHRLVRALIRDTTGVHAFSHLAQHEMRLERSFHRAYRQLQRLQRSASSA